MGKEEKFDAKKFFDFGGIAWATTLGLMVKVIVLIVLVFGGIAVKNALFPPAPANINAPEITVAEGGSVTYNVTQSGQKKAWWMPSPFIEVFTQASTESDELGLGVRAGARWEF